MRADIQHLISRMSELETVDTFNAIERHLLGELQQSSTTEAGFDAASSKLSGVLQAVFNVLPKDVQQLMLMNPERAVLVQGNHEGTGLLNDLAAR
ncbi:hypothetical protein K7X08_001956 [Anisodus acutangulus]|uniref:Uncharacterized protein n=1 Tax=Anisodus acutangulus TaxID=402998 RepID=A0A9Q1LS37_9SOLA|nr:hypothetical protein K7X08_001956 [Anisodus acutangulus]